MSYALEHENESKRLEKQARIGAYSLEEELSAIDFSNFKKVLDAGCGGGMVSRYISDLNPFLEIDAIDGSSTRLEQAKFASRNYDINYQVSSLENIDKPSGQYDFIVCRYVYEYLANPLMVTKELSRLLSPGGVLHIIDFDGLFFNFHTSDNEFNKSLAMVKKGISVDTFVGRKIQSLISSSDLKLIDRKLTVHEFLGEGLELEAENNIDRFEALGPQIKKILGEGQGEQFMRDYVSYMFDPGSVLFTNKFIYTAIKE